MKGLTLILGDWMVRCGSIRRAWMLRRGHEWVEFMGDYWRYRQIGPVTILRRVR